MSNEPLSQSEFILYQTEDGRTRIQCRFEDETVWLSQALMAELFQKDVRTITEPVNDFETPDRIYLVSNSSDFVCQSAPFLVG